MLLAALLAKAVTCVALNVYHEARGEPLAGQYAVALVTRNRATVSDEGVCREVYRPYQFSWTRGRAPRAHGPAWDTARRVAQETLVGAVLDMTRGATYYHAVTVRPVWVRGLTPTCRLGRHIFYHVSAAAGIMGVPSRPNWSHLVSIHAIAGGAHEVAYEVGSYYTSTTRLGSPPGRFIVDAGAH